MARAILRDDFPTYQPANPGLALDEDSRSSVPAILEGSTDVIPGTPRPSGEVYPLVTVRERFSTGRNDDGDLLYSWADTVKDASMIFSETREEVNDKSGLTMIRATMSILYARSAPAVSESSTLHTSDGHSWSVLSVERLPDRLVFTAERIANV